MIFWPLEVQQRHFTGRNYVRSQCVFSFLISLSDFNSDIRIQVPGMKPGGGGGCKVDDLNILCNVSAVED